MCTYVTIIKGDHEYKRKQGRYKGGVEGGKGCTEDEIILSKNIKII